MADGSNNVAQIVLEFLLPTAGGGVTTYPIKITLRGVKRFKSECGEGEPDIREIPQAPHVTRAV